MKNTFFQIYHSVYYGSFWKKWKSLSNDVSCFYFYMVRLLKWNQVWVKYGHIYITCSWNAMIKQWYTKCQFSHPISFHSTLIYEVIQREKCAGAQCRVASTSDKVNWSLRCKEEFHKCICTYPGFQNIHTPMVSVLKIYHKCFIFFYYFGILFTRCIYVNWFVLSFEYPDFIHLQISVNTIPLSASVHS